MKKGFTLIEVIVTIVLVGIFMSAGMSIFIETGKNTSNVEIIIIGQSLAEEKIEILTAKNYSTVTDEAQTNFTGDFALFSCQTIVNYVMPANLDAISPSDAGYKRIRVQIRHPSITNFVQLETVKANF